MQPYIGRKSLASNPSDSGDSVELIFATLRPRAADNEGRMFTSQSCDFLRLGESGCRQTLVLQYSAKLHRLPGLMPPQW